MTQQSNSTTSLPIAKPKDSANSNPNLQSFEPSPSSATQTTSLPSNPVSSQTTKLANLTQPIQSSSLQSSIPTRPTPSSQSLPIPPAQPSVKRPRPSKPRATNLSHPTTTANTVTPTPVPPHPDSVPREVFLLTGGVTPAPLVPTVPVASGAKPRRKVTWKWKQFRNSARKDSLLLSHWVKAGADNDEPSDYVFARFNKPVKLVTYTDNEYEQALKDLLPFCDHPPPGAKAKRSIALKARKERKEANDDQKSTSNDQKDADNDVQMTDIEEQKKVDPSISETNPVAQGTQGNLKNGIYQVPVQHTWTKEETDQLFNLCKQFDLRFPVVHDRWPDDLPSRSIDELKDRYYSVSKRLIEWRSKQNPDFMSSLPLALQKHCQAITMNPFDYEYECIRKNQLECQYSRSKVELREEEETVREARRIEANRKRLAKERQRLAKLLTPAGDIGMSGDGKKDLDQAIAAATVAMPHKTFPHRKHGSGAYARSSLIYAPVSQSARISKRIDAALVELGVGTRPMPTSIVVDNFDLLRMDILSYIELHRTVQKKEEDTHMLRVKLAKLKGESPPSPPPGVTISHKKRRADDGEIAPLFGGVLSRQS